MRRFYILGIVVLLASFTMTACSFNTGGDKGTDAVEVIKDGPIVEVLYFHGKQRCATCMAIENETKALIESELASLVDEGKVVMRVIDITTEEGKSIANKYKVSYSSLFAVVKNGDKEKAEDLTRFAFANARNNPEEYRKELKDMIVKSLK
ncbi:MAG: nitrophenyl compound nitroreductase subunit ArsF family protein [Candidatus Limimorpha sp.]